MKIWLTHDAELECFHDGWRVPVVGDTLVLPTVAKQGATVIIVLIILSS